jgi:hypothetical protein
VAIDFVIVVLGVYVAVWVGSQQAAREQERRVGARDAQEDRRRHLASRASSLESFVRMLQGEIAALIDPALLSEICFYYDERDGLGQKFVRYSIFTENEILPRLKGDARAFYTEDHTRLAPAFEAHVDRLQAWRKDVATLHQWARCLDDRLREPSTAGPSCRPALGGTIDVGRPQ